MSDASHAGWVGGLSDRLRDLAGNSAVLAGVAVMALKLWIVFIAGLIMLLSQYFGIAAALLTVAVLVAAVALALMIMLRSRLRLQRLRAQVRQSKAPKNMQTAVLAALPNLLHNRSGALLVGSGLVIGMVVFLSVIGLLTNLVFFVSRDLYATILFHNFLGTFGVVQALAAQDNLAAFASLQWPLIGTAFVALLALVVADVLVIRRE